MASRSTAPTVSHHWPVVGDGASGPPYERVWCPILPRNLPSVSVCLSACLSAGYLIDQFLKDGINDRTDE
jgi:hypothetical protein